MSLLHRAMLKLRHPDPYEIEDAEYADDYFESPSYMGASTSAAKSATSSPEPPECALVATFIANDPQPAVRAEGVGPEAGDEGAKLGNRVLNEEPRTPDFRTAAHDPETPATVHPPARSMEASLPKNLQERLAAMFLGAPGGPRRHIGGG